VAERHIIAAHAASSPRTPIILRLIQIRLPRVLYLIVFFRLLIQG
jgi:hypothetical protein